MYHQTPNAKTQKAGDDMVLEKLDPAIEQSIIQEIRQAVKKAIIPMTTINGCI
jgi:hypothetical protein